MIDGEIAVPSRDNQGLDFWALQQRIHPAASRVRLLAEQTPASLIVFDVLALDEENLMPRPFRERRAALEDAMVAADPPVHLTPITRDQDVARRWFDLFEGAGIDGLIAKDGAHTYRPNKRVMAKIKHERTADCVVVGYRVHKSSRDAIGSLLLGLYSDEGALVPVGVVGAFPMARRLELFAELQPLVTDFADHPLALGGRRGGRSAAWERREQVEPHQGSLVRSTAARAGDRGPLRLYGGSAVPAHDAVRALAPGPRSDLVRLRPARAAGAPGPWRRPRRPSWVT